ncbi:MAG: peptidase M50 [Myxococcaceae bacterium]|nr:peptidase M50 [Myxococcaceae bacterium]
MFRFRLAGIPVQVHFSHLLIATLLAWSFANSERNVAEWPGTVLAAPQHPERGATLVLVMLVWGVIISLSVLVHELGHAVAGRAWGWRPTVQLLGLGGRTMPNAPGEIAWHREVLFTLAGPAAGLTLGILAGALGWGLESLGGMPRLVLYALKGAFLANLFWALVNLLPVEPLDGGHIARVILMRIFGRKGFLYAQLMTLTFAAIGLGGSFLLKAPILGLLFGLWGFRSMTVIQAWRQGAIPEAGHPLLLELDRAAAALTEGRLTDAKELAQRVLQAIDAPPVASARAHLVLGLAAVKSADAQEALRHFRQVEGLPIPPEALAAAHSLAGDDETALPLWAEAARVSSQPLVRAEFAGTLLRLGRGDEVRALPGVSLAHAFLAAERVFYLREQWTRAAEMAEGAFAAEPRPSSAYTAACNRARARDVEAALQYLELARLHGYADADAARTDPDLATLHGHPSFEAWLAKLSMTNG